MSVVWLKVWYDLWHNKIRTLLAAASIAAGVFAVGSMFGMADQLLTGMDRAHRQVLPSHINLYVDRPIDRETALALKRVPGVLDIEPTNDVTVRYKIRPEDKWETGIVVMRDDYARQKYDLVQLKEGTWPRRSALAIERLSSQYYGLDIGDQVIVEYAKKERRFPIVGKIRHPFVPPPQFGGQAFFFVDAEGMERFGIPPGKFTQMLIRVDPYSAEHAKEVASAIKDRLARQGIGVAATLYQDPEKHWGRVFVEGITLVMQMLAALSLAMSVVLVLNTVTALVTQQTNQIGILKAIGGTSGTIVGIYLAGVFTYGLLALIVSLPLGMFLAYGMTQWFLNLFNIDYSTFAFSTRAVVLQVVAALLVPILAALWPVLQGAFISVRQAIASYGLGGDFGSSWIDRVVERIGGRLLPAHYAMALANTFRRKGRLALTELVLVIAGAMFLMVMSLSSSITATLDAEFGRRTYDVAIHFEGTQRVEQVTKVAAAVEGVEKVGVWFARSASILRQGQKLREAGLGAQLQGVPVDDPMYRPPIVAGRWLRVGDGNVVVINQETAERNDIRLGDRITLDLAELGDSDWEVVGFYKLIFGGGFSTDAIYAPRQAVWEAARQKGRGDVAYVRTRDHSMAGAQRVAEQLEDLFRERNIKIFVTQTLLKERQGADGQFAVFIAMLLALALIVAFVGGIGLMGALSISVIERTKEIGILRAVGARSRTILGMFVLEGVVQSFLSWLVAVPISLAATPGLAATLGKTMFGADLSYRYNAQAVLVWLGIIFVIGALASLVPARNATRISVRQSLAYD